RKGKEVMVESDTPKKKRLQEQIDAQVTRKLEEQQEKENMRMNEQIARDAEVERIRRGRTSGDDLHLRQSQQRRPMTKKQKREYYMAIIRSNLGWRVKDFKGMTFEEIEAKFAEVWKQEQVKKQKSSEEAPKIETSTEDVTKEKIKEMMQLVPIEDVYVQAIQVKHPIIDWKVHTEGQRRT
nr:hypothetical protein [Tanacetum cinerariifolium]